VKRSTCEGEQNDIIKTLHRAFGERSASLRLGANAIFDPAEQGARSQMGIVRSFGRPDDTREGGFVVLENLRGQPIYAKVAEDDVFSTLKTGQAVTVRAFDPEPIQADRNEALGRANVVSKNRNGAWDIPDDYLDRVRAYHKQLAKRLPAPLARGNGARRNMA